MAENSTDLNSYCFDRSVNLSDVQQSLKILLLPKDIVEHRNEDNCLDIVASVDRGKLFEKYLSKRYNLKNESLPIKDQECRLDFKTTKKSEMDASHFKIGEKTILNKTESNNRSISVMELLLGTGKAGEIGIGEESLKVVCQLIGNENANLIFSYTEKNKANMNSQISVKKGEWVNIASVLKELNDKTKALGIPQTEVGQTTGKIETIYELQLK